MTCDASAPFSKGAAAHGAQRQELRGLSARYDELMPLPYKSALKLPARRLRSNQTDAEQHLWQRLRRKQLGISFNRQKPIGPFIVDFYCHEARLVIELDGGQHFEEAHQRKDQARDAHLQRMGLQVLRFDNLQALTETEAVLEVIHQAVLHAADSAKAPR